MKRPLVEIERKFRVANQDFKTESFRHTHIIQAFLNSSPERTVRIRIRDQKGYLTIKGIGDGLGAKRFEWEKEIEYRDALSLLALCEPGRIEKIRYEIQVGKHVFEVDEFEGDNKGLIMAEVELSHEMEEFDKPLWLGKEVTGDKRFYNSFLSKLPYSKWLKEEK